MALETLSIEHIHPSYTVYLGHFENIQNADFLHQQLLGRNAEFEYAFVDASVVMSRRQLLSAVFKAITAATNGTLKTPNVHSEIVVSLNPSNNIADSYRRFGISPTTKNLLVVKVTYSSNSNPAPSKDSIQAHLSEHVKGSPIDVTDANIAATTDITKVRKYYKLNGLNWLEAIKDEQHKRAELDTLVVSAIALRGL